VGQLRAAVDVVPAVTAPRNVRAIIRVLLPAWGLQGSVVDDALLLASELVSNAVEHAQGEASLELEVLLADGWLRLALSDGSSITPVVREVRHEGERGRGMQLVAEVAERWGHEERNGGKRVWFDLRADGTA